MQRLGGCKVPQTRNNPLLKDAKPRTGASPPVPVKRGLYHYDRIRLVNRQLKAVTRQLDGLIARIAGDDDCLGQPSEQHDATILRSLPGVGRIVIATLLAEAHHAIRARDYHALRTLTGVAPVTKRSGKSCRVEMRKACSHRLRRAVYHWARVATQHDARSRLRYAALRSRGHTHGRALRGVADRLLSVACAMLESRTTYDPTRVGMSSTLPLPP